MRKYFLIIILIVVANLPVSSQTTRKEKSDSLKKQIPTLKGKEKVDCLNLLAQTVYEGNWKQRADSVYFYASIAYEEAKKIDYKKGIAASLTNLAISEHLRGIHFRINKEDDKETVAGTEKYLSQAIPIAEQLQDYETLGTANEYWSDMVYIKSKFKDHDARAMYLKKAIDYFHKAGNDHKEGEDCLYQGERYGERGYYEEALNYLQPALELNKKALPKAQTAEEMEYCIYLYNQSLVDMSSLYQFAGDYQTALEYLNISQRFYDSLKLPWDFASEKVGLFDALGQYDSSFYYLNKMKLQNPENPWTYMGIGATFLKANQPDSALALLNKSVLYFKKRSSGMGNYSYDLPDELLLNMAEAYVAKRQFNEAMPYATEGLRKAAGHERRPNVMKGYELLSKIHRNLGNNDSAYQYLIKYTTLKDSIDNRQFMFRLNSLKKVAEDAKKESRIGFLDRDNKIKEQQLKQEASLKKFLIIGFALLFLAGLSIVRSLSLKRKNEKLVSDKKQSELQQKVAELEMQALRAQMNPHFIFNCLSSINRFILKNETETASDYLTRFSRLIRMVLINSQRSLITLEDEVEMLRLYLDMERLRFKNSFDYNITYTNSVDAGAIFTPPLLLQPFCENAIWHGLMHLPGGRQGGTRQGRLDITMNAENNILNCTIADNGIGRQKSAEIKSKSGEEKKSLGLKITAERLALLNQEKGIHTFYEIEDLKDEDGNAAGTKVHLKISLKEPVEEFA